MDVVLKLGTLATIYGFAIFVICDNSDAFELDEYFLDRRAQTEPRVPLDSDVAVALFSYQIDELTRRYPRHEYRFYVGRGSEVGPISDVPGEVIERLEGVGRPVGHGSSFAYDGDGPAIFLYVEWVRRIDDDTLIVLGGHWPYSGVSYRLDLIDDAWTVTSERTVWIACHVDVTTPDNRMRSATAAAY